VLKEVVTGLPNFSIEHPEVCKGCALGKYTKTAFPSSDSRSGGILDLIHLRHMWARVSSKEIQNLCKLNQITITNCGLAPTLPIVCLLRMLSFDGLFA
jgi:hypothetical protein